MAHEHLIQTLRRHVSLDDVDCEVLAGAFRPMRLKRGQTLLRAGDAARDAAFVIGGCLRSYSLDGNGFEHTLQFATSGWWITDMYSWISGKPADQQIEAVRDSHVLLLDRRDQLRLFDRVPGLERYFRILTENALVSTRQRLAENMGLTARQRYHNFCRRHPELLHLIPQKLIASYIGITPEFLSKIRAERRG
jgi:CRP-like cAMP-binding protein